MKTTIISQFCTDLRLRSWKRIGIRREQRYQVASVFSAPRWRQFEVFHYLRKKRNISSNILNIRLMDALPVLPRPRLQPWGAAARWPGSAGLGRRSPRCSRRIRRLKVWNKVCKHNAFFWKNTDHPLGRPPGTSRRLPWRTCSLPSCHRTERSRRSRPLKLKRKCFSLANLKIYLGIHLTFGSPELRTPGAEEELVVLLAQGRRQPSMYHSCQQQ